MLGLSLEVRISPVRRALARKEIHHPDCQRFRLCFRGQAFLGNAPTAYLMLLRVHLDAGMDR